jgi:hypothetical protein
VIPVRQATSLAGIVDRQRIVGRLTPEKMRGSAALPTESEIILDKFAVLD